MSLIVPQVVDDFGGLVYCFPYRGVCAPQELRHCFHIPEPGHCAGFFYGRHTAQRQNKRGEIMKFIAIAFIFLASNWPWFVALAAVSVVARLLSSLIHIQ